MYKILIIIGTRPEAIKMAPLAQQLRQDGAFNLKVCVTGQHRQMLDQVLQLFEIEPDFDLNLMQTGQDLATLTSRILSGLSDVLSQFQPDLVLVHGDTTTTFASTLASFYQHIPVAHIEAGLRTGNLNAPYPEEANRILTGVLAQYHFAPTEQAKLHLLAEGKLPETIWVTGNTVIDSLHLTLQKIAKNRPLAQALAQDYPFLREDKSLILVTAHRRENLGEGFEGICRGVIAIAQRYPDVQIVYPLHLNPKIVEPVVRWLSGYANIFLLDPQPYLSFVYLMNRATLILTDSGGIQEEATALDKPVLLLRETTERLEAVKAGYVRLVGTDPEKIEYEVARLLNNQQADNPRYQQRDLYGDGTACAKIVASLKQILVNKNEQI